MDKLRRILFTALLLLAPLALAGAGVLAWQLVAEAETTANITVTYTPGFIAISCNASDYDWGNVSLGTTINTSTAYFAIDNTSSVTTNHTISVVNATWTGGSAHTHSDGGTAGVDTVGLLANKGGTWGTGDVIVKILASGPDKIATGQAATTDYTFGLGLHVPTLSSDGVEKTNTVRVVASQS